MRTLRKWALVCFLPVFLLFHSNAHAQTEIILANTIHVIDWLQTREAAKNPKFKEVNPLIGHNPSLGRVNRYFLLTGIGMNILYRVLPPEYKDVFNMSFIVLRGAIVTYNLSIGVKF